jgi:hypothetical protein
MKPVRAARICYNRWLQMRNMRLGVVAACVLAGGSLWALGPEESESQQLVEKYLEAARTQSEALRGVQMEVNFDARLPKLEKQGRLKALRKISKLGMITYKALGFSGDNMIKSQVIARYLDGETQSRNIAITPDNYKFKLKGAANWDGRRVYVLQVTPRRKEVGLFHGELWLDADTSMPVREAGRFVKSPSVFLKKIEFVRDYEIQDGVAIPKHVESKADVRMFGPAELTIEYTNFSRTELADDDLPDASNR